MSGTYETLFQPRGYGSISASTSSARVAVTTETASQNEYPIIVAIGSRTGDADVYVTFGDSAVVATATTGSLVNGGSVRGFRLPSGTTHVAAITASGTATVCVETGRGF